MIAEARERVEKIKELVKKNRETITPHKVCAHTRTQIDTTTYTNTNRRFYSKTLFSQLNNYTSQKERRAPVALRVVYTRPIVG